MAIHPLRNPVFLTDSVGNPLSGVSAATATIASTTSESNIIDCSTPSTRARKLIMPASLRGITRISALECVTIDGTFTPVGDDDFSEWYVEIVASRSASLPARIFDTCNYLIFRGGSAGSVQSASGGDLAMTVYRG